ncbi:conserved hypothetical protein [Trichinella spiralis]|nr:conserved hypothetical protein [Trichinella spiralis]
MTNELDGWIEEEGNENDSDKQFSLRSQFINVDFLLKMF